jgi:hypothetical protein
MARILCRPAVRFDFDEANCNDLCEEEKRGSSSRWAGRLVKLLDRFDIEKLLAMLTMLSFRMTEFADARM